jgi:hypothetical protein
MTTGLAGVAHRIAHRFSTGLVDNRQRAAPSLPDIGAITARSIGFISSNCCTMGIDKDFFM